MKFLLILLLFASNVNCSLPLNYRLFNASQVQVTNLNYDSTILEIQKKVVDLTSPNDLFGIKEFITLYESPNQYKSDAISFLENQKYSFDEKAIVIYAMQGADLKTYKMFLKDVIKLFRQNKINESMMGLSLSAQINKRYIVIKNYNDIEISTMLTDLKNSDNVSLEFKERIVRIITGKTWREVKKLL